MFRDRVEHADCITSVCSGGGGHVGGAGGVSGGW